MLVIGAVLAAPLLRLDTELARLGAPSEPRPVLTFANSAMEWLRSIVGAASDAFMQTPMN